MFKTSVLLSSTVSAFLIFLTTNTKCSPNQLQLQPKSKGKRYVGEEDHFNVVMQCVQRTRDVDTKAEELRENLNIGNKNKTQGANKEQNQQKL